jgi:hypothetical protein
MVCNEILIKRINSAKQTVPGEGVVKKSFYVLPACGNACKTTKANVI